MIFFGKCRMRVAVGTPAIVAVAVVTAAAATAAVFRTTASVV